MNRCPWKGLENSQLYQDYHDNQWGIPLHDDRDLFELFLLESFHCGLSWLIVLKKREHFREAFHQFNPEQIANYEETKIQALLENKDIIRSRGKIEATITNAQAFLKIQEEFGSFSDYLWGFTQYQTLYLPHEGEITTSPLSDKIAKDLKKQGFKYMGSVTCFSYLEAVGIYNNHCPTCYKHHKPET